MFDIVDTAFSYERELIVCSFLQDFSKGKGSSLRLICNAHTAFLLGGGQNNTSGGKERGDSNNLTLYYFKVYGEKKKERETIRCYTF